MQSREPIVTLLTDFGTEDGYAGAMKGVLYRGIPGVRVVDISHRIEPYNVRQAAFTLLNYYRFFPAGTVHIIVIDPGVGTKRQGLVVQTEKYWFIGPDNGVFSFMYRWESFRAFRIRSSEFGGEVSPTFHGRDIFAPAAVRLLQGQDAGQFAETVSQLESFDEPIQRMPDGSFILKVIHIDHFGNLILNFHRDDWKRLGEPKNVRIRFKKGFLFGIKNTFGDTQPGQLLCLWDSSGFLQIAQNRGNAAEMLQMAVGDEVTLFIQ